MVVTPIQALERAIGKRVTVRLKTGHEYNGKLILSDEHMNLLLTDCQEVEANKPLKRLGEALVRGNNILFIRL